jgi:hypothetical protein
MNGIPLVYARQDPLTKRNDLNLLNSTEYTDTGLSIGTNSSSNLRLSYDTDDATGHLRTDAFKIHSSSLGLTNLPTANSSVTNNSYLLIDPSGNVTKGNSQFPGDINVMLSHIQNDLFTVETTLNNLSFQVSNLEPSRTNAAVKTNTFWIYILAGLVTLVIIGIIIFLIMWIMNKNKVHHTIRHTHNQLDRVTITLHEMSEYLKELREQIPTRLSPPEFSGKRFMMSHIRNMV